MANVIWRGPVHLAQPDSRTLKTGASILPGLAVTVTAGVFQLAATSKVDYFIMHNRAYIGETVDTAVPSGETGEAFKPVPQYEFNVRFAAATYAPGAVLSIAAGQFKAAATGEVAVAVFDEAASRAISANGLGDVRILANSYVVPA
jgi:hypothetical protein